MLKQEKDKLAEENKTIREKAFADVKDLEEYIQQEAKVVKDKVKQLEVTLVQQMEVIERQEIEIEKLSQDLTKQVAQEGAQEGVRHEGSTQELAHVEARQEVLQEVTLQDEDNEEAHDRENESDSNEPWEDQRRHKFECPICGLGRKTRGQIEQHMSLHDKPEEDSQFNCKDCQFQTMNRDQLYQHMDMVHKKFECNLCNTIFKSRKDLNTHNKETNNKNFKPCRNFPKIVNMTVNATLTISSLTRVNMSALSVEMFLKIRPLCSTISKVTMARRYVKDSKKINALLGKGVSIDTF